ncbi:MAG: TetR/AcrR family transcriptional regulator [Candidatus Binatia bacterium]|nr:TetR/AcrR family transcriptional regulator [Candidatus Binatia bacterium]
MKRSEGDPQPAWRQRAVVRGLSAARSRAEQRVQKYMDAAFELMDEKGTSDFTIQEVIDRSKQSLRGFYQYFDGKDELLLALFEESMREAVTDIEKALKPKDEPVERLRAFTIRLHEWCDPVESPRKRGKHNRVPTSEFALQFAGKDPERVREAMAPIFRMLVELIEAAVAAKAIKVADARRAATLVQQTVMCGWLSNRLVRSPGDRITADEAWQFCLRGLSG